MAKCVLETLIHAPTVVPRGVIVKGYVKGNVKMAGQVKNVKHNVLINSVQNVIKKMETCVNSVKETFSQLIVI
jgi:hypothetical protein